MNVAFLLLSFYEFGDGNQRSALHYSKASRKRFTVKPNTNTICIQMDNTLRARHKSCFLRPDIGPCRADIVQWYFDVKQGKCYRFFWGGCQGNGNRFESKKECYDYCMLNTSYTSTNLPNYCSLTFEYGTCFGYFNRWAWDTVAKTCKQRIYSGCGGNKNNFETKTECETTCSKLLNNNTVENIYTTCVPYSVIKQS